MMATSGVELWLAGLKIGRKTNFIMENVKRILPYVLNLFFIVEIILLIVKTDSDKSPIIFMVFYPILVLLNIVFLIIFIFFKNKIFIRILKLNLILLIILILPIILIISSI